MIPSLPFAPDCEDKVEPQPFTAPDSDQEWTNYHMDQSGKDMVPDPKDNNSDEEPISEEMCELPPFEESEKEEEEEVKGDKDSDMMGSDESVDLSDEENDNPVLKKKVDWGEDDENAQAQAKQDLGFLFSKSTAIKKKKTKDEV